MTRTINHVRSCVSLAVAAANKWWIRNMKQLLTRVQRTHTRYTYISTGGSEKIATSRQCTDAPQPAGSSKSSTWDGCAGGTASTGGTGGTWGAGGAGEPLRHLRHPALKKLTGSQILERLQSTERSAGSSFIYKRRAEDTAAWGVVEDTSS